MKSALLATWWGTSQPPEPGAINFCWFSHAGYGFYYGITSVSFVIALEDSDRSGVQWRRHWRTSLFPSGSSSTVAFVTRTQSAHHERRRPLVPSWDNHPSPRSPEGTCPPIMGQALPSMPGPNNFGCFARNHRTENNKSLSAEKGAWDGKIPIHSQKEGCQYLLRWRKSAYCFLFIKITKYEQITMKKTSKLIWFLISGRQVI